MFKKNLLKTAAVLCVLAASAGVFAACNRKVDAEIVRNISELTVNVYTARTERAEITVMTGERETPYNVNGESGALQPYTIITVRPFEMTDDPAPYDYIINAGKNVYRGKFNLHPFGISYTDTVNKKFDGEASVTLTSGDYTEEAALNSQHTDTMIGWEDALRAGLNSVKKEVESLYSGSKLMGEV